MIPSTNCAGDVYLCQWQDQKKSSRSIEYGLSQAYDDVSWTTQQQIDTSLGH